MKRVILLLTGLAISHFMMAQTFQFGIKGGMNISTIHPSRDFSNFIYRPALGCNFGLLGRIHLNRRLSVQPEVMYSREGSKTNWLDQPGEVQLSYVDIPVLVQLVVGKGLRIQTGPQIGI